MYRVSAGKSFGVNCPETTILKLNVTVQAQSLRIGPVHRCLATVDIIILCLAHLIFHHLAQFFENTTSTVILLPGFLISQIGKDLSLMKGVKRNFRSRQNITVLAQSYDNMITIPLDCFSYTLIRKLIQDKFSIGWIIV